MDVCKQRAGGALDLAEGEEAKSIYETPLHTVDAPELMHESLKDAAKCKAAEALILMMSTMSERQLEKVQIFPSRLIKQIPEVPSELLSLISRRLARSMIIDRSYVVLNAIDCELNTHFMHHYSINLFSFEPMAKARSACNWYLENQFQISFDLELAKKQRLFQGLDDAIKQGRETYLQIHSVKAGFTVEELHQYFPRHVRGRFRELMQYCNQERTKGSAPTIYDDDAINEYKELVNRYLQTSDNVLEAKLLAYYDVIVNSDEVFPITSYEHPR